MLVTYYMHTSKRPTHLGLKPCEMLAADANVYADQTLGSGTEQHQKDSVDWHHTGACVS